MGSGAKRKRDRGIIRIPRTKRLLSDRDGANVAVRADGNGQRSGTMRRQEQCRTFGLMRPRDAARETAAGMAIWGVFKDPKVTVRSQAGELGDAPSQAARYFIEERNRQGGGNLKGFILKSTAREVRVRLCLS